MRVTGKNRKAQCEGKEPFGSPGHAGDVLKRLVWRKPDYDIFDFSIYPCRYCQQWHLGRTRFISYVLGSPEEPKEKKKEEKPPEQRNDLPGQLVLLRKSRKSKRIILYNEEGF